MLLRFRKDGERLKMGGGWGVVVVVVIGLVRMKLWVLFLVVYLKLLFLVMEWRF